MSADHIARTALLLLCWPLLIGCEETMDSRFSPALFPQKFEQYKATPHYRALATGYIDRRNRIFLLLLVMGP
jgi:hypothetical protein